MLKGRELTQLLAITHLGVASLTKRIAELRSLGFDVVGERKLDYRGRSYTSYYIPHAMEDTEEER